MEGLQELWNQYNDTDFGRELAWDYVFQKVYIHSCLKKQKEIVKDCNSQTSPVALPHSKLVVEGFSAL